MIQLTIDDKLLEIQAERTILEACREHGIYIPTLCYHPALKPYGGCRLCMVELVWDSGDTQLVAACAYPCKQGLVVRSNSDAVKKSRRLTLELLLASAFQTPEMIMLAQQLGVQDIRYKMQQADSCILCGLCVRACQEIVGISAISLTHRGISKQVNTPYKIASSSCIGCGTCVLICPTGHIQLCDVISFQSDHVFPSEHEQALCKLCADARIGPKSDDLLTSIPENLLTISKEVSNN